MIKVCIIAAIQAFKWTIMALYILKLTGTLAVLLILKVKVFIDWKKLTLTKIENWIEKVKIIYDTIIG